MNRSIRRTVPPAACLLVIALAAGLQPAAAQHAQGVTQSDSRTISIDFAGGPIASYIDAIRSRTRAVNVLLATPEAAQVLVPAVRLDSVDVGSAVELLAGSAKLLSGGDVEVRVESIGQGEITANPVYRISTSHPGAFSGSRVRVWSIADVLGEKIAWEDVLTAVETAVELLGRSSTQAEIRFHESMGLLMAAGSMEQLDAIESVVMEIRNRAAQSAYTELQVGAEVAGDFYTWIEEMRKFDASQENLAGGLKDCQEKLNAANVKLAQREARSADIQAKFEALVTHREQLVRELEDLRAKLAARDATIATLKQRSADNPLD